MSRYVRCRSSSVTKSSSTSSTDDDDDVLSSIPAGYCGPGDAKGEILPIEKLVDVKLVKNGRAFLVKWMGYPDFENTWELEEELPPVLVTRFDIKRISNEIDKDASKNIDNLISDTSGPTGDSTIATKTGKKYFNKCPAKELKDGKARKTTKSDGFPKGWIADEIKGMEAGSSLTKMVVKCKGKDKLVTVTYEYCKRKIPQLVIQFFQKHLIH